MLVGRMGQKWKQVKTNKTMFFGIVKFGFMSIYLVLYLHALMFWAPVTGCWLGCALTFASEAKFEIEAKISFRLEAKKAWFHMIHFDAKHQKSEVKKKVK